MDNKAKRTRADRRERMTTVSVRIPQTLLDLYRSQPGHTKLMRKILTDYALTLTKDVIPVGDGTDTREVSEE